MRLAQVVRLLKAEPVSLNCDLDREVEFGAAADLMSDVLSFARSGAVLLTGLTNSQVVRTAEVAGVAAIVFVRGKRVPPETLRLAEEAGIPLLCSPVNMFDACGCLYQAGLRHHDLQPTGVPPLREGAKGEGES